MSERRTHACVIYNVLNFVQRLHTHVIARAGFLGRIGLIEPHARRVAADGDGVAW